MLQGHCKPGDSLLYCRFVLCSYRRSGIFCDCCCVRYRDSTHCGVYHVFNYVSIFCVQYSSLRLKLSTSCPVCSGGMNRGEKEITS